MAELHVSAFSKLTLSLHVTGRRADGYHELDATMVSVDAPLDTLVLRPAARTSLTVTGPFRGGRSGRRGPNLAWRAADACGAPVEIALHKGIPSGAGLGGGSADAAAVLVALDGDVATAARLGADVPFCMRGGFAHVGGIGDELRTAPVPALAIVVATPPFGCSTADVYRAWDELGGPRAAVNDLEPAAERVEPRLAAFKRAVESGGRRDGDTRGKRFVVRGRVRRPRSRGRGARPRCDGGHGLRVARLDHRQPASASVPERETAAPRGRPLLTYPADDAASGSSSAASCASSCALRLRRFLINEPMTRRDGIRRCRKASQGGNRDRS